jgi:hypothetical protein
MRLPTGKHIKEGVKRPFTSNKLPGRNKAEQLTPHPLTHQWITSPPSSSLPSPRQHRCPSIPTTPAVLMAQAAGCVSSLRGHDSSSTSASYPSSAASVSVPYLLHLCSSSMQHHRHRSSLAFRSSRVSSFAPTGGYNDPHTFSTYGAKSSLDWAERHCIHFTYPGIVGNIPHVLDALFASVSHFTYNYDNYWHPWKKQLCKTK